MESEPAPRVERPRPTDMSEEQLGFRPQNAVRWLTPSVLISTGAQSVMAGDLRLLRGQTGAAGHAAGDGVRARRRRRAVVRLRRRPRGRVRRHLLGRLAARRDGAAARGRDGTLAARADPRHGRRRGLPGRRPPRPTRTAARASTAPRCRSPRPSAPRLFALPGNHDWYDGLTSFLRVFAQQRPFGGWATEQTRSYFAVSLPQRWWLFAIDTQFDDYVDAPQLEYFHDAAKQTRSPATRSSSARRRPRGCRPARAGRPRATTRSSSSCAR